MCSVFRSKFFVLLTLLAFPYSLFAISSATLDTIGMYRVPQNSFEMVKGLGIDLVVVASDTLPVGDLAVILDKAQAAGLKTLTGIYREPFEPLKILPTIQALKSQQALSYWHIIDRPDMGKVEPDIIAQLHQFIHVSDLTSRPTVISFSDSPFRYSNGERIKGLIKSLGVYKDSADIIAVGHHDDPKKLRAFLQEHVFPQVQGRRWWALVTLAQKPADLKKAVEIFMEGKPSGILYDGFADEDRFFSLNEKPAVQEALREINYALRGMEIPKPAALAAVASATTAVNAPGMPGVMMPPPGSPGASMPPGQGMGMLPPFATAPGMPTGVPPGFLAPPQGPPSAAPPPTPAPAAQTGASPSTAVPSGQQPVQMSSSTYPPGGMPYQQYQGGNSGLNRR